MMMQAKYCHVMVRLDVMQEQPICVLTHELPILTAMHSPENVQVLDEQPDIEREVDPDSEYQRLEGLYGMRKSTNTSFVQEVYGPAVLNRIASFIGKTVGQINSGQSGQAEPVIVETYSGDFDDGVQAYNNNDYETAFNLFRKAAEQGEARAQYNLGLMCASGDGVTQDDKEAARWFLKAAEQGVAGAQHNLGMMYKNGEGVTQDDKEAARWVLKAAEQGEANAQYNLGLLYKKGDGVTQDDKEAARWVLKAAEQGVAGAQHNLGVMYANGVGVTQDYKEAARWFLKAAEQGVASAQNRLGLMYATGKGVTQDFEKCYVWASVAAASGNENGKKVRDLCVETLTIETLNRAQQTAEEYFEKYSWSFIQ